MELYIFTLENAPILPSSKLSYGSIPGVAASGKVSLTYHETPVQPSHDKSCSKPSYPIAINAPFLHGMRSRWEGIYTLSTFFF
jgi:hypothetical protein